MKKSNWGNTKKKKGKKAIDSTAKEEKKAQLRNYGKKYSYVW